MILDKRPDCHDHACMFATRTMPKLMPAAIAGSGLLGGYLLFAHLMQSNATINEAVGNIAPEVAAYFGCSCPFCTRSAACSIPADEIGVNRLEYVSVRDLMGK